MRRASIIASILALVTVSLQVLAADPLIIHTTEFGVGKFHRADNKAHAYAANSVWAPYILADNAKTDKVLIVKNTDQSYTVFFSTLDEMMTSVQQISKTENRPVSVLNVHGHGLPGAMWFPKDQTALDSFACYQWRDAASGSDADNIDQYYHPATASDIRQIRQLSNGTGFSVPCTTGLKEWREGVNKNTGFKSVLAADAQVHFLSCVVGLGSVGDNFTKGLATLLLANGKGHIETSVNFGLGDWSMPDGMGFWDYITDEQLKHDNQIYPVDRQDSEIAQKGTIRLASSPQGNGWVTSLVTDQNYMPLGFDTLSIGRPVVPSDFAISETLPNSIRILGTKYRAPVLK